MHFKTCKGLMLIMMYSLDKCTVVRNSNLHAKLTDNSTLLPTILAHKSDLAGSEFFLFFFCFFFQKFQKQYLCYINIYLV